MKKITEFPEWQVLEEHQKSLISAQIRDLFNEDPKRSGRFTTQSGQISLDYSRNRMTAQTLKYLIDLAETCQLRSKIDALFAGQPINITERRPALHTALRDKDQTPIWHHGSNIANEVATTQKLLQTFVRQVHQGEWRGVTGKIIKHVVNIGIGGSYTGPMMAVNALKDFAISSLKIHFISGVDKSQLQEVWEQIDPETTLFIVSSKSFTTLETLTNTKTLLRLMTEKLGPQVINPHFIAVTAAKQKAVDFGIPKENIFPIWEWVGGRYSLWSAIGLPLMLSIGNENFADFLEGAYEMDMHFKNSPFNENIPVILGLMGIWNGNFLNARAHVIAPYSYRLRYLIPYLQQADMESNGKQTDIYGRPIQYQTGPVIFGEEGCHAQHTYNQLLHQGQHLIPVDFILIKNSELPEDDHHPLLLASGLSQSAAFLRGKTIAEAKQLLLKSGLSEDEAAELASHQVIPGNKPHNLLFLERLTPHSLGALIAMYEHKIFVQGIIWGVNSFDQWGVELGKQLLPGILKNLTALEKSQ